MQSPTPQIALLIDADNAPAQSIRTIILKLEKTGTVNIRKAYGNWEKSNLNPWKERLQKYAIRPIQQYDYTKGKNATDVALTIDAMDLIHTTNIRIFAIVSSDCDFTPLAMRLRERGAIVYGFGEAKTPKPFTKACSQFFCFLPKFASLATISDSTQELPRHTTTPVLSECAIKPNDPQDKTRSPSTSTHIQNTRSQQSITTQTPTPPIGTKISVNRQKTGQELKQNTKLIQTIRQTIAANQDPNGWSLLSPIGSQGKIQPQQYGYKKLSSLLKAIDLFEIKQDNTVLKVRCKLSKSA